MTDEERQGADSTTDPHEEEEERAPTPFDSPWFIPVLCWAFTLWFAWDAWVEPMEDHLAFNRYGFGFVLGAALYNTLQVRRRIPYLLSALMLGYAAWLGYLGFLGSEQTWYSDGTLTRIFNRWGSGFFLICAAGFALRDSLRMRSADPEPLG